MAISFIKLDAPYDSEMNGDFRVIAKIEDGSYALFSRENKKDIRYWDNARIETPTDLINLLTHLAGKRWTQAYDLAIIARFIARDKGFEGVH